MIQYRQPIRLQSIAYKQPIGLPPMDSLQYWGLPCAVPVGVDSNFLKKMVVCAATLTNSMLFLLCYGHVALLMYVNEFRDGEDSTFDPVVEFICVHQFIS